MNTLLNDTVDALLLQLYESNVQNHVNTRPYDMFQNYE